MKALLWLASLLSAMLLSVEAHAQDEPNPLIGSHLYRSYCLVCHGADGKSRGPLAGKLNFDPADLSSEQYQTKDLEDLAALIGGYRRMEESNMPNWDIVLSRTELLDIAAYISKITLADLRFRGDTRRGRIVYKRACTACHGKRGTGRGVLAHLIGISMADFTASEDLKKMSDEELTNTIRDGKGDYMPSWKGFLNDDEIADVASYLRLLGR
jgi:cbb3-type cytochrome c oxidase subunit III